MNKTTKTVFALLAVAAVSTGVLFAADWLTHALLREQATDRVHTVYGDFFDAVRYEELPREGFDAVEEAFIAVNNGGETVGYAVTVSVQGYAGRIEVHTAVSPDAARVNGIRIGSHNETPGYGARITGNTFTDQFRDAVAPLYLNGGNQPKGDGQYRATAKQEEFGFFDTVELTVKDGQITAVNWDAYDADGNSKKTLSKNGEYVMAEGSLPWHEQAQIMEQALLYTQDPQKLLYNADSGKTDAYSGATVRVSAFITLAAEALSQARPDEASGTAVDGLSGATTSSKAVIAAANTAVQFAQAQRSSQGG